jgi:XTP/dITP diphosphohydrolase
VRLYCATGNPGKLREFQALAGDRVELALAPDFARLPACEETGATFAENAVLKATYYGRHAAGMLFAEDSGLEVDALRGDPGVRSARFSGQGDEANNRLLQEKLRGVADRRARYVCVIALVEDARLVRTFRGTVEGRILDEPRGKGGFGYDPLFYYPPFQQTFAELPLAEKNKWSHRSQAFAQLLAFWLSGGSGAAAG